LYVVRKAIISIFFLKLYTYCILTVYLRILTCWLRKW